jgi:hypothetical protein
LSDKIGQKLFSWPTIAQIEEPPEGSQVTRDTKRFYGRPTIKAAGDQNEQSELRKSLMTPGVNDEGAHNEAQRVSMRNEGVLCGSEKKKPGMPRPIECLDPLEAGKVAIMNPLGFFGRLGCSQ